MRGPFVDPLAIAMARKLGGGGGGVKPSGEIAIDKNGTYDVTQYASANVNVSGGGGGGGGDSSKPVRFLDYDGTVVQSYTAEEFAALEAMPENPDHSGDEIPLTAQGWNWSLADAKAYVAKYGALEVGQMYITTDGKTHIKIYIDPDTPANRRVMTLRWQQSVANGVTIDWGDGTTPESFSETSATEHDHTYAQTGWYDITLTVTAGTIAFVGSNVSSIVGSKMGAKVYKNYLIRVVRFGSGLLAADSIGTYAFHSCYTLTSITIPNGVTYIGPYAFYNCYALTSITIPNSVTDYGDYYICTNCFNLTSFIISNRVTCIGVSHFSGCRKLAHITIPESVTSIGKNAFNSCVSLTSITIPEGVTSIADAFPYCTNLASITISEGVTSIGSSAFSDCSRITSITFPNSVTSIGSKAFYDAGAVSEYHFLSVTPPTIQNNTFPNIASDCVIYVPAASVEDYKAAANWSALASKIQAEPA